MTTRQREAQTRVQPGLPAQVGVHLGIGNTRQAVAGPLAPRVFCIEIADAVTRPPARCQKPLATQLSTAPLGGAGVAKCGAASFRLIHDQLIAAVDPE